MKQEDAKKRIKGGAAVLIAAVIGAVLLFWAFGSAAGDERDEAAGAIKDTVTEKALQCYVIEGAYPSDLTYLEDHYGLTVNRNDFYVDYRSVGENLPPQVTVAPKGDGK